MTYLTLEEAAERLHRSKRAMQELVSKQAVPHRRLPGVRRVLIPLEEFEAWINGAELETILPASGGRVVRPKNG